MVNKPLDNIGKPDKMLKAAPQGDGKKQGRVYPRGLSCGQHYPGECPASCLHRGDRLSKRQIDETNGGEFTASVIITPEPDDPPDEPACLWCFFNPAVPEFDPYCSLDCAVASAIDDERNR